MSLVDLVSSCGVVLKKVATTNGGEYAGPCPSCGGSDRFRVWPADRGGRGSYWCRGCGRSGDDVQLLKDFRGMSYPEAFRAVGREMPAGYRPSVYRPAAAGHGGECGNGDVGPGSGDVFEPRVFTPPVETWQIKAEAFVDTAHQALLKNESALHYLAGRGLDIQAVKGFKLGWHEGENGRNCAFRPRTAWGLPREHNPKTGRDKMLWLPRGLVIPCYKAGSLYRVRIRRPAEDIQTDRDVKYYILPGSGMELAGHNPDHRAYIVVEADLDEMLIARHAGSIVGSVALGSAAAKPGRGMYLHLQKAIRLLICLDFDDAGACSGEWWLKQFPQARRWPVPAGKDPGEAYSLGVDIKAWIHAGLPPAVTMELAQDERYVPPGDLYPIQELELLLKQYPVTITATAESWEIHFNGLRNRQICARIRHLFADDEVHWYFRMYHPDDLITGDNCHVVAPEEARA
jgi:DNA primase